MCFCSLFFSLPLIFTLSAASISHFLTAVINFSCFSSNEIRLRCVFISHSSSLLVIHANVDTKFKSKKDSALMLYMFSVSKSPGAHLPPRRAGVLEVREFHPGLHEGWTNGRIIVSQPKFLGCLDKQIFLRRRGARRDGCFRRLL